MYGFFRTLNIVARGVAWAFRKLWSVVSSLFFESSRQEIPKSPDERKSKPNSPVTEQHTIRKKESVTESQRAQLIADFKIALPVTAHKKEEKILRLSQETESKDAYSAPRA